MKIVAFAAALLLLAAGCRRPPQAQRLEWPVMGTVAALSCRGSAAGAQPMQNDVAALYERLSAKLSAWDARSELGRFARSEPRDVTLLSAEIRPCYEAAMDLCRISGGAFNPHLGEKLDALGFPRASPVDLGGIAKGFAVDRACGLLMRHHAKNAAQGLLVDLGGNLRVVSGTWRTGIRNPFAVTHKAQEPWVGIVALTNGEAIATSGHYERFTVQDGRRISHILDGRTGRPVSGMAGVSVIAPTALLADGLSTTLFVLGPEAGGAFLEAHYPHTAALWIPDTPQAPHVIATPAMGARLRDARYPVTLLP